MSFALKRVSSSTSRQLSGNASREDASPERSSTPLSASATRSSPASMRRTGANDSRPATSTSPATTISARGLAPPKSSASRSESITSRRRSPSDVIARTADGWSSSRTKRERQSTLFRRTRRLTPTRPSESCDQSPRNSPSERMSTRVTLILAASRASAMSSAAPSGSAAARTTRPFSVSRTVSQDTVSGSSGNGEMAERIPDAVSTASASSGTLTILTTRRDKGKASTASPGTISGPSGRNSPPSKATTCILSAIWINYIKIWGFWERPRANVSYIRSWGSQRPLQRFRHRQKGPFP